MSIIVNTSGMTRLADRMLNAIPAVQRAIEGAVEKAVDEIHTDATSAAPVLTGELKGSIEKEVDGTHGRVFTELRYAQYVEFGTYKDQPQPFMTPAGDKQQRKFPNRVRGLVASTVRGVLG